MMGADGGDRKSDVVFCVRGNHDCDRYFGDECVSSGVCDEGSLFCGEEGEAWERGEGFGQRQKFGGGANE